ncbi:MAG: translation initiation factor IF-2, partial [Candidatus Nitrosotenuis sp.]
MLTKADYEKLLKRIQDRISEKKDTGERFELPAPDVMWEGQRTILRNFMDFAKILRRDPEKVL